MKADDYIKALEPEVIKGARENTKLKLTEQILVFLNQLSPKKMSDNNNSRGKNVNRMTKQIPTECLGIRKTLDHSFLK